MVEKLEKAAKAPAANGADASRAAPGLGAANGLLDPGLVLLPYLEMSRALLRAHHNALAMMEANRALGDALRGIVRRQQDLAFELAEMSFAEGADRAAAPADDQDRAIMFERAADAVRELGQAVIDAQLQALHTLQAKTRTGEGASGERGAASA